MYTRDSRVARCVGGSHLLLRGLGLLCFLRDIVPEVFTAWTGRYATCPAVKTSRSAIIGSSVCWGAGDAQRQSQQTARERGGRSHALLSFVHRLCVGSRGKRPRERRHSPCGGRVTTDWRGVVIRHKKQRFAHAHNAPSAHRCQPPLFMIIYCFIGVINVLLVFFRMLNTCFFFSALVYLSGRTQWWD